MRSPRRHRALLALLLISAALVAAGCGSSSNTTSTSTKIHFATTKFAIHAGLAFGTFHHFIYEPFKAGDFSHPFRHSLKILEAAAAALFVKHEVKVALADAKQSKVLSHVVAPLAALGGVLALVRSSLKSATPNAQAINSANSNVSSAESQSSYAGQPIKERAAATPSG